MVNRLLRQATTRPITKPALLAVIITAAASVTASASVAVVVIAVVDEIENTIKT